MSVRNLCSPLAKWLSNPHAAATPSHRSAAGRLLPALTSLIVLGLLAGCASSPYRTGYYYPAEHGQGDYYSAPAERSYRDPYYYGYGPYHGGFYHYPYYRSHGFYGRYPYSPYRFHRQSIGLGYGYGHGGYGPSYGYGYSGGHGYGPSYGFGLHFSDNRHRGGHGRGHDRSHDPHRGDHRRDRYPDRDHDRPNPPNRPQPVRVIHHPDDENRYIRRSTPIKHAPDTFRPMTGNTRADRTLPSSDRTRAPRLAAQPIPTTPMAHQAPIRVREGTRFDPGPRRIDIDSSPPSRQRSEPPKSVPRSAAPPSRPTSDRGEAESEHLR